MDQFGVKVTRHDWENSAIGYTLDHTASVFLIAPDGKLVEQIMFGTHYQDILADTRLVLAHYERH